MKCKECGLDHSKPIDQAIKEWEDESAEEQDEPLKLAA